MCDDVIHIWPHLFLEGLICLPKLVCRISGGGRLRLKYDGTRAETRFRLSAKRTSPFKSAPGGWGVSSVDYWQPRCGDQRAEIILFLASTLITAWKCRYKAGRKGYKGLVSVKWFVVCTNSWKLNLSWVSQSLFQKCRRESLKQHVLAEELYVGYWTEVKMWKLVSQWHFQLCANADQ